MWTLISWLHQKPADLDLSHFQKRAKNFDKVMDTVGVLIRLNNSMLFKCFVCCLSALSQCFVLVIFLVFVRPQSNGANFYIVKVYNGAKRKDMNGAKLTCTFISCSLCIWYRRFRVYIVFGLPFQIYQNI